MKTDLIRSLGRTSFASLVDLNGPAVAAPADNAKHGAHHDLECRKIQFALGCDVAKDTVTLFDSRSRKTVTVANTTAALKTVLKPYAGCTDLLALCEATGGYEDKLLHVLLALAIPAHRADAARVKAFIRACGMMAKTDPIHARHIAEYGLARAGSLPRWQAPDRQQAKMKLLVLPAALRIHATAAAIGDAALPPAGDGSSGRCCLLPPWPPVTARAISPSSTDGYIGVSSALRPGRCPRLPPAECAAL